MAKQAWYSTTKNKLLLGAASVVAIGVLLSGCMKQADEPMPKLTGIIRKW
ncbi:hypothetical protein [Paenibacillus aestuarii]|uniref:Cyclic lactone autoinducer peptide n=1 Tax=Paenibacillus aestuarii TaxID=516965 RepID=A0ABW0K5H4_9BACL|nr:hypothetical protein [Paenibacillus aestuarii]